MTTVRRTPDSRFDNLAGYPFSPNMVDVAADDGVALAMHYVDEGPADAAAVLCLHGQPTWHWVKFCAEARVLRVSDVVRFSSGGTLGDDEARAYDAPFPDDSYMAGARQFPSLVPIMPDNVAIAANRAAWRVFETWDKPFLTAFSDRDPVTAGRHERFQRAIPGARNQKHVTIEGAGHFLQEDKPGELAKAVLDFVDGNPT